MGIGGYCGGTGDLKGSEILDWVTDDRNFILLKQCLFSNLEHMNKFI